MNPLIQTLFQHYNKETLYTLTINVTKKLNLGITVFLVIVFSLSLQHRINAEQISQNPLNTNDYNVAIQSINNTNTDTPIFNLYSKALEICKKSNLCGPGDHNKYIQIKSLVVFDGVDKSRYKKDSIMWELKFITYSPSTITYGKRPYNAREIIKAKPLYPNKTYSLCIYPKNEEFRCSNWNYSE